jgi:pimeloyl-ACP methyl ester carboxylesterase/DNA-binding SARP family transcriptional activator
VELPPIRYVHTDDGVSIAYTVFGEGSPLLYSFAGPGMSNFEHEWSLPGLVEQYEVLSRQHTVVRFDWRNCGLSTRHVDDVSPAAHLRDLLALQDHLSFERAALRVHGSAPIAIRYAATHPDRVSALVLSSPSVIVASPDEVPTVRGRLLSIAAEADWRLFSRLFAIGLTGWEGAETAWFTALLESADPQDFFRTVGAVSSDDVTDLLARVACPVLIVQRREPPNYFYDEVDPERHLADSRLLTRDLRRSRLVLLDGSSLMITTEPASTRAVVEFLRDVDNETRSPRHDRHVETGVGASTGRVATVLGPVTFIGDDGRRVDLSSVGQRRLLAALAATAGSTVRAESLGEMVDLRGSALRTAVSRLRARIGEDAITTDGAGYRLDVPIDAAHFEALLGRPGAGAERLADLDAAIAWWNGAAFDEFRHEWWAQSEATRLDELRVVAEEDRAELLIGLGRSGEAISSLGALVSAHPYRDRVRGLLVQALACEGRQADALRAYQDYRSFLADEVGTEPSASVRSIERRVASSVGDERQVVIERLRSVGRWTDDGPH